ncbi:hypothetical protein EAF04_010001 [Stromatinia cepivora]|nr:hypothetical protein EAF04_010001 [Stromatinia cepivora]
MRAYNEIVARVETTDHDLPAELRQSMVERRVWIRFFDQEPFPPPLELRVVDGFIDPLVSQEVIEQPPA